MSKKRLKRKPHGAVLAEFTTNLYVLLLFLVFPLLDLSIVSFRAFFLWYAANQAVSAACKARTYLESIDTKDDPTKTNYRSACDIARTRANQIKTMFSGIHWEESANNPDVLIVREPINTKSKDAQPAKVFSRGHGAPLEQGDAPDASENIYTCRVVIRGEVDPLLTIPWFDIPGLSSPLSLTVSSEDKYENVPGLVM